MRMMISNLLTMKTHRKVFHLLQAALFTILFITGCNKYSPASESGVLVSRTPSPTETLLPAYQQTAQSAQVAAEVAGAQAHAILAELAVTQTAASLSMTQAAATDGFFTKQTAAYHAQETRQAENALATVSQEAYTRSVEQTAAANESRDWVNSKAKEWQAMGYLTRVQSNEKGHRLGRKVTETLLQASGFSG
jgi:hypothetical protein